MPLCGTASPIFVIASLKRARSSAFWIAGSFAPISSTSYFSNTPDSASSTDTFKAVCPPSVGSNACGRSLAITSSTVSAVIGSMYV